jgi:hypothetical protein
MANEMLKFKKGLFKNLPEVSASTVGTIFVTTDEQAMYVDVAADKRIRISDFIRVDTVEKITPPYSTSSLYYVEADNALLKYVETTDDEGVTTGAWKQVNGTDDLKTRVGALEEAASGLRADLGTKGEAANTTTAFGRIATLEGTVSTHGTDIEALKSAVGMNDEGEVEGLAGSVAALREDLTELEIEVHGNDGNGGIKGTVAAQGETLNSHTTKIEALETASAQHVTKEEAKAFAKTADIEGTLAKVDTEGTVTEAITAAVNGEKSRAEGAENALNERINGLSENLAKVKETADNAMTEEQVNGKITAARTEISAEIDADVQAALTTVSKTYATQAALNATNEIVGSHTTSLTKLNGDANTDGSVANAKKAGTDALALIGDASSGLTKTVNEHTAALTILNGDANTNGSVANAKKAGTEAKVVADANTESINGIKQTITTLATKQELTNLEGTLTGKIADEINAANSMKYIGGVDGTNPELDHKVLPTEGVKVGDTYVVEAAFTHPTAGDVLPGDLFIAFGDETNGVITANLSWTHVKTGYDASLDQKLTGADNKIKLSTGTGVAGTEVAFTATGSASVEVKNNTVTIGMVWEDFDVEE